ncbi:MAG TPA: kelch repeat-containing protein [Candidatus Saccharimonadales bacterium]|nr:kelch repeat-containing protein [Candidatus Saccharimonadales bacterium]
MSGAPDRLRWSRPLIGIASVAVIGAGMGAYFGIRAVQGAGSASSAGQPGARSGAAMAYDPVDRTVVLFGGQSRSGSLNDTWTWNGSVWTQAHPGTPPPPLDNPQMTYDPVSHDVLLVGGEQLANHGQACSGGSGSSSGSTGSSGSRTTFIPPGTPIPAMAPVPSATGTARHLTPVGVPGCATLVAPSASTWLWNGSDWSAASGSTPYLALGSSSLATDPVSERVVLLPRGPFAEPALGVAQPVIACPMLHKAIPDGQPPCPWPITIAPAWTWNGHRWTVIPASATNSSSVLFSSSIVDDAVSGRLAAFGGNVVQPAPTPFPCLACAGSVSSRPSAARTAAESIWNGTSWQAAITYGGGPSTPGVTFTGDPATHSDVALTADRQTWLWTGVWTRAHPGTTPPITSGAASAYDAATGRVVMFGGFGSTSRAAGLYDQTWTWDGSDWTQRGGRAGPSVTIPIPSPVSVPPALPCQPIAEPALPAGATGVAPPPAVCKAVGSSPGSTGGASVITTGGGVVSP